eukprot:TRINITY_DN19364_c0_g1_i2.p1 TRINITY_DN19364_c0_g1~~TRINITY_DN19364_c0_g1_i2.p1  ORF type:complete len:372 (+),score=39.72 TRINITY_DN19364_c0_g1_i2:55-1170(+)
MVGTPNARRPRAGSQSSGSSGSGSHNPLAAARRVLMSELPDDAKSSRILCYARARPAGGAGRGGQGACVLVAIPSRCASWAQPCPHSPASLPAADRALVVSPTVAPAQSPSGTSTPQTQPLTGRKKGRQQPPIDRMPIKRESCCHLETVPLVIGKRYHSHSLLPPDHKHIGRHSHSEQPWIGDDDEEHTGVAPHTHASADGRHGADTDPYHSWCSPGSRPPVESVDCSECPECTPEEGNQRCGTPVSVLRVSSAGSLPSTPASRTLAISDDGGDVALPDDSEVWAVWYTQSGFVCLCLCDAAMLLRMSISAWRIPGDGMLLSDVPPPYQCWYHPVAHNATHYARHCAAHLAGDSPTVCCLSTHSGMRCTVQ